MNKKKELAKSNKIASENILEITAILAALSDIEQSSYPTNVLLGIAYKKITKVFHNVEKNRNFQN